MSLRDYVVASRIVTIKGENKLALRGLGFDDIQHLLVNRDGLIAAALELFENGFDVETLTEQQQRGFATKLLTQLPELAGELIALGADEPDMADNARRLPAPVQLDALMAVYELTFTEPDSVKNFFGRLADMLSSIPKMVGKTANPATLASLKAGLIASGETLPSSNRKATSTPASTRSGGSRVKRK